MLQIAELGESQKLEAWDTPYYTSKLKKKCLEVSSSDFLPYFSLGACMDGLNLIMKSLFGITLQNSEMLPGELWSPEIYKLAVTHETEGLLGYIYCDLFDRSGKPNQDCHFTIQGGRVNNDGSYQVKLNELIKSIYILILFTILESYSGHNVEFNTSEMGSTVIINTIHG